MEETEKEDIVCNVARTNANNNDKAAVKNSTKSVTISYIDVTTTCTPPHQISISKHIFSTPPVTFNLENNLFNGVNNSFGRISPTLVTTSNASSFILNSQFTDDCISMQSPTNLSYQSPFEYDSNNKNPKLFKIDDKHDDVNHLVTPKIEFIPDLFTTSPSLQDHEKADNTMEINLNSQKNGQGTQTFLINHNTHYNIKNVTATPDEERMQMTKTTPDSIPFSQAFTVFPQNDPFESQAYKTFSFKKSLPIITSAPKLQTFELPKHADIISSTCSLTEEININTYALDHPRLDLDYTFVKERFSSLKECIFDPINSSTNALVKKYRAETCRIINMIINTLSAHSPSHVLEKYEKLRDIIRGKDFEMLGKTYKLLSLTNLITFPRENKPIPTFRGQTNNLSSKEKVLRYIEDCLARSIINQAIKQESNPQSAFVIAPLANALASEFPWFHLILVANFYHHLMQLFQDILIVSHADYDRKVGDLSENYSEDGIRQLRGAFQLFLALTATPVPSKLASTYDSDHRSAATTFGFRSNSSSIGFSDNKSLGSPGNGLYNPGRVWYFLTKTLNALNPEFFLLQKNLNSRLQTCIILSDTLKYASHVVFQTYGRQAQKLLHDTKFISQIPFRSINQEGLPGQNYLAMLISCLQTQLSFMIKNKEKCRTSYPQGYLDHKFWL